MEARQEAFSEGYERAKQDLEPLLHQSLEAGAILAYRDVYECLRQVKTPDDLAEVCRGVAKSANLGS